MTTLTLVASVCACTPATAKDDSRVPRAATLSDVPPATVEHLDLEAAMGTWYVVLTNFEFWTRRDRTDVTFVYQGDDLEHPLVLIDDTSKFLERGKPRQFHGYDFQDPTLAGHLMWQGEGALYGLKNQWFVVAVDPGGQWMIIYFPKSTIGTGVGLEVITRSPHPTDEQIAAVLATIRADPDLVARAQGLFVMPHGDGPPPDWDLGDLGR